MVRLGISNFTTSLVGKCRQSYNLYVSFLLWNTTGQMGVTTTIASIYLLLSSDLVERIFYILHVHVR